jgi:putative ABC transport system substrate-binding protein
MRRREFITLLGTAAAGQSLPFIRVSHSEAMRKRPVIAWLGAVWNSGMPDLVRENTFRSFLRGMSDLGYVRDQDYDFLVLNKIFPDPVPVLEELVTRIRPDVIVASATWEAVAIRKATSSIPIVCPAMADGVHLGLIVSEAHPGGNVTGLEPYLGGLPTKQMELIREVVPRQTCWPASGHGRPKGSASTLGP